MAESNEMYKKKTADKNNRPQFPKRAVITGGMPYGNKTLHFGHVGGVFVFADVYARFLRDRIGLSHRPKLQQAFFGIDNRKFRIR